MDAYEAWNWAEHMLQPLGRFLRPCANHIFGVPMLFCLEHLPKEQSNLSAVRLLTAHDLHHGNTDVSRTLHQVREG